MNNLVKEDMILKINLPEKVFKSKMATLEWLKNSLLLQIQVYPKHVSSVYTIFIQPPRKFRIAMIQYPVYPCAQLVLVVER